MKKVVSLSVILLILITLILVGCQSQEGNDENDEPGDVEPIEVGILVPLSGPSAATGQEMRNSYLLVQEKVNEAGGILGRPLELLFEDSKDPEAAVAAIEKLAGREEVQFILGGVSSTNSYAIAEPLKQYDPLIAWTGGAASSVEEAYGDNDLFFHYHPWEYHNVSSLIDFLESVEARSVAIAYEDGLFGTSNINICEELFADTGIEIVATEAFKTGSPDYTPLLTKVKEYQADVFVWIGYPADAIPMATQAKEVDFAPKAFVAYVPGWPEGYAQMPEGQYVTAVQVSQPDVSDPVAQEYYNAYLTAYGDPPRSYWGPLAYTNLDSLVEAMEAAQSLEKEAVAEALAQISYPSPLGWELEFKPSKICPHQGFTELVIVQWQEGRMEVVFPENLATGDLVYPFPLWQER